MKTKKPIWAMLFAIYMMATVLSLTMPSIKAEASTTDTGILSQQSDSSAGIATQDTQDIQITEVQLTLEIPKVGAENNDIIVSVPANAGYTVTTTGEGKWKDPGGNVAGSFVNSDEYRAEFHVEAAAGYVLSADTKILVNGSEEGVTFLGGEGNPASIFEFICKPQLIGNITQIDLTDVPTAVQGATAGSYSYSDSEGAYHVTGTWHCYNTDTGQYDEMSVSTDRFENGKVYELLLVIDLADGYMLDPNCRMSVNDIEYGFSNWEYGGELRIPASFTTEVELVQIQADAIPKAVIGEAFQDTTISIPVVEGSNVTASGYWTYTDETGMEYRTGTFESGKEYYFYLEIVPQTGYSLSENLMFRIGEEDIWPDEGSATKAKLGIRTSFAAVIQEAELLNLPDASLGDTLQTGYFQVNVPVGAAYTAGAWWMYYDTANNVWEYVDATKGTHKVQSGVAYRLTVQLAPISGHEFADSVQLKAYDILHQPTNVVPRWVIFEKDFSFQQQISQVAVSGISEPTLDTIPSVSELKVPSDANYTIADAQWRDVDDGSAVAIFESGHSYFLEIMLTPKEGYAFQSNISVFLDGEEIEADVTETDLHIRKEFSFKDVLPEIQISNIPEMKVGEMAVADITIPKDAKYSVDVFWSIWNNKKERFEPFSGTFEAEKIYELFINVIPHAGYRFDKDTTRFLINGVENENARVWESNAEYHKEFSAGLTAIDKIELEVLAPVTGHHTSIKPVVTLPSGANYKLGDNTGWIQGKLDQYWDLNNEYFEEADNYGAYISLLAKDGYKFAENLVVLVNGTVPPKGAVQILQSESRITFFFQFTSNVEINENFQDSDISQELKAAGFDTVSKIDEHLKTAMHKLNSNLKGTVLYDVILTYSNDGGVTWQEADESHFPLDGKLKVSIKVPEGTNLADYNYTVLHMFSSSAFGKVPGTTEQPGVTERTGDDGVQYLDFYVTGLSPILVGWEKEEIVSSESDSEEAEPESADDEELSNQDASAPYLKSPKTGEDTPIALWAFMSVVSLVGIWSAAKVWSRKY